MKYRANCGCGLVGELGLTYDKETDSFLITIDNPYRALIIHYCPSCGSEIYKKKDD